MDVAFWFDPGCPWSWITSRWIEEVAPERDLAIQWRSFSLFEKNKAALPEELREQAMSTHTLLRVCEAARTHHGEAAVGALYREFGRAIHHDGDERAADLVPLLQRAGVDTALADAREDAALDAVISASMAEALESAGADVGTPLTRIGAATRPVFSGPILSPAPTGADAVALFDGLVTVQTACAEGLYELKRTRDVGPQLPSRP